ncbi:hypothetical protein A7M79_01040 [Acinetobacter baumannii]|uniref:hypothetical protein n=1 Tax=Acinetobacter baumannii TaxID=470 RepID=UPI0008DD8A15|nr:hypothetical protein [Acinetobacter baumannii]OIH12103.1 hypothetical protein A7M79_01040 [Acinetobacter baumannii]
MSRGAISTSEDINQILPFYHKLIEGDVSDTLPKLQKISESGNLYASYILASYFLFGKVPRFYKFHKQYEQGIVRKQSFIEINEQVGLQYFIRMLKIQANVIQYYQLKGIYDFYSILKGTDPFFTTNDIECRPKEGKNVHLLDLFSKSENIMDLLVKLDHFEIYLDYAKSKLKSSERNHSEEDFKTAISLLNRIVLKTDFNQFNLYAIRSANLILGKIYLHGTTYLKPDIKKGIGYLLEANLDEGYVFLINYYKEFGDSYRKSIRKAIGMISNINLRNTLLVENGFPEIVPPNFSKILENIKNAVEVTNFNTMEKISYEVELTEEEKKAKEEQMLKEAQELAASFDTSLFEEDKGESDDEGGDVDTTDFGDSDDDIGFVEEEYDQDILGDDVITAESFEIPNEVHEFDPEALMDSIDVNFDSHEYEHVTSDEELRPELGM